MRFKDFELILRHVTYKPGWRIHVNPPDDISGIASIAIKFSAPDVHDPSREIEVGMYENLPVDLIDSFETPGDALRWIGSALEKMERHEIDEWFKFRGEQVNPPHTEEERKQAAMLRYHESERGAADEERHRRALHDVWRRPWEPKPIL